MIMAEARKRHLNRPSFQQRFAERETPKKVTRQSTSPTLWKLSQAGVILQEVIRDVVGAVKTCSKVAASTRTLQRLADDRREQEAALSANISDELEEDEDIYTVAYVHAKLAMPCPQGQTEPVMNWRSLALAAMRKQLHDNEKAESEWYGLASTLAE